MLITDRKGQRISTVVYTPFGEVYEDDDNDEKDSYGLDSTTFKYTGQELDESTELAYYRGRYYSPVLGRFLTPDSIVPDSSNGQAYNRYAYVLNNPLRYSDPSGHSYLDFNNDGTVTHPTVTNDKNPTGLTTSDEPDFLEWDDATKSYVTYQQDFGTDLVRNFFSMFPHYEPQSFLERRKFQLDYIEHNPATTLTELAQMVTGIGRLPLDPGTKLRMLKRFRDLYDQIGLFPPGHTPYGPIEELDALTIQVPRPNPELPKNCMEGCGDIYEFSNHTIYDKVKYGICISGCGFELLDNLMKGNLPGNGPPGIHNP